MFNLNFNNTNKIRNEHLWLKEIPKKGTTSLLWTEPKIAPCGFRIYTQTAKYNLNKGCFFLNIPSDYLFYYKIIIYPFKYAGRRSSIFFGVFIAKKKRFFVVLKLFSSLRSACYIRKVNYTKPKTMQWVFYNRLSVNFFCCVLDALPRGWKLFKM